MVTEIALTPEVFSAAANTNREQWLKSLEGLAKDCFPRNAAAPVIISNLNAGKWLEEAVRYSKRFPDPISGDDKKILWRIQNIITQIKEVLVQRPAAGNQPASELAGEINWVAEARESHQNERLGRIVMTNAVYDSQSNRIPQYYPLNRVTEKTFWDGIKSCRKLEMNTDTQVAMLHPILLHAGFIALKLPHMHGANNDETAFAKEVLKYANADTGAYPTPEVDLHISGSNGSGDEAIRSNIANGIQRELGGIVPGGQKIKLYFWPKFINRTLLAGVITTMSGVRMRKSMWGIDFQHVALPRDRHNTRERSNWALADTEELSQMHDEYISNIPSNVVLKELSF
jgi:hypothetical protein